MAAARVPRPRLCPSAGLQPGAVAASCTAQTRHHRLPRRRPRPSRRLCLPIHYWATVGWTLCYNPPLFSPIGWTPRRVCPEKVPCDIPSRVAVRNSRAGGGGGRADRNPQLGARPPPARPPREVFTLGQKGPAKQKGWAVAGSAAGGGRLLGLGVLPALKFKQLPTRCRPLCGRQRWAAARGRSNDSHEGQR